MSSRPLSYDGLKCVLQHMEANKRIQVAYHCPSIRTAERVTPLKLEHLKLFDEEIQINKTIYQIDVTWKYQLGQEAYYMEHMEEDRITPIPYRRFLQLTIDTPGKQAIIERYEQNKRCSDAMKQLGEHLLGRRTMPIYLKHLPLDDLEIVLRVPLGVKFHFGRLEYKTEFGPTLDTLLPIIHESSYPLKNLVITAHEERDVTHPVVREAQTLHLNIIERDGTSLGPKLKSISNKLVHIYHREGFDIAHLLALIENWITTNRTIGTEFLFHHQPLAPRDMVKMKYRFNGLFDKKGDLLLPMTPVSQLWIGHVQIDGLGESLEWGVRLAVVAKL